MTSSEDPLIALLRSLGTDEHHHTDQTLFHHLLGTQALLEAWGNPQHICVAGLFHSIYGTRSYRIASVPLDKRAQLQQAISDPAEQLAYLFCVCDRRTFLTADLDRQTFLVRDVVHDQDVEVDRSTLAALLEVEVANVLEQVPRMRDRLEPGRIAQMVERLRTMAPLLSAGAVQALEAELGATAP